METQKKFKSDAQAKFESALLESEEIFCIFARMYLDERQEMESFLEFCWRKISQGRKEAP